MTLRSLSLPPILPIYPLREQAVFPFMVLPLVIKAHDMALVQAAMQGDSLIGLVPTLATVGQERFENLATIGTVCRINQMFRFPEGGCKLVVEGLQRIRVVAPTQRSPFLMAMVEAVAEKEGKTPVAEALMQSINTLLKVIQAYGRSLPESVLKIIDQIEEPGRLADLVTVYLGLPMREQQRLLENLDPLDRIKEVYLLLTAQVQKLQGRGELPSLAARRLGKVLIEPSPDDAQKEDFEGASDDDPRQSEKKQFRTRIEKSGMPPKVKTVAEKELARLERINPASPEYTVSRTYLDYLCSVPWDEGTEECLEIDAAQKVLDADHFDLKEVKERILEYLAVRTLKATTKGPILCFVGPPGVGKTSLGRSIARAMGRKFVRISLGGVKDEAEIRGHRRTYIGALPGRIVQEICRVEVNNPVFMLDEVDKIGQDFRGDPASALLEVLDPEQNDSFADHYLDVPFDLSKVMFITTANTMDPIPPALRDRMEVIRLAGYSDEEKLQIAFKYLIPKQILENGLDDHPVRFGAQAVEKIIKNYTREAGVRHLERQIASICRKIAKETAQHRPARSRVAAADIEGLLGSRTFYSEVANEEDQIGVVTGLAWTENGGDIIFVEATRMVGHQGLTLTGSLGDVMQESAKTALSYVRSHAADFGIDADFFAQSDIHIHVPSGAIPKDGPSAGVTIATALISLLTESPVRRDVAMSGELTLSGRILPVGGVKEKVLAARRAGATCILLPENNRENVRELDEPLQQEMRIVFVSSMHDVVAQALLPGLDGCPQRSTLAPSRSESLIVRP